MDGDYPNSPLIIPFPGHPICQGVGRGPPLFLSVGEAHRDLISLLPAFPLPPLRSTTPSRKLQERLLAALDRQSFADLQADFSALNDPQVKSYNLRRLLSVSSHDSTAFLQSIPSIRQLSMGNEVFAITLRRILGLPLIPTSLAGIMCMCGTPVSDLHLQTCLRASRYQS